MSWERNSMPVKRKEKKEEKGENILGPDYVVEGQMDIYDYLSDISVPERPGTISDNKSEKTEKQGKY